MDNIPNIIIANESVSDNYSPPKIEITDTKVEKGFTSSTTDFEEDTW